MEQRDQHKLKNRYYTLRSVPKGTFESLFDVSLLYGLGVDSTSEFERISVVVSIWSLQVYIVSTSVGLKF